MKSVVQLGVMFFALAVVDCQAQQTPPRQQPPQPPALAHSQPATPVTQPPPASSAESAVPPTPLIDPEPSAANYLVWGPPPSATDDGPTTYWLAEESAGSRVVAQIPGVFVAVGSDIWRWSTKEWHMETVCATADPGTFADESIFVGAVVQEVGSQEVVDVIKGDAEPLNCNSILSSRTDLWGSVGPYLFVDSSYHEYGGGAHGMNLGSFVVFDLAARTTWYGWDKEITVPEAAQKPVKQAMGESAGARAPDGRPLFVTLRPSAVRPAYAPDGGLSLALYFEAADTNVPTLVMMSSRGLPRSPDGLPASIPKRFMPYAIAPPAVARFARDSKLVLGGWSLLPTGKPMPDAARAIFAGRP